MILQKDTKEVLTHLGILFVLIVVSLSVFKTWYHPTDLQEKDLKSLKPKQETSLEIPILLYHYVEYVTDERDFIRESLNVPPHVFEAQIKTLKDAGYKFIWPKEIPNLLKDPQNRQNKYAILSFDDGYEDFYTDVFPILKKHNIKAVNYVVSNFRNKLNYMKDAQIKDLVESGLVEIGSHTYSHPRLDIIEETAANNEVLLGKKSLEEAFNIHIESFAYPYGGHNETTEKFVESAGFTTAVTLDEGTMVTRELLFRLMRVRPGHNMGADLLAIIEE